MPRKHGGKGAVRDVAAEQFHLGVEQLKAHPMFGPLYAHARIVREQHRGFPEDGWAIVTANGVISVHPTRLVREYVLVRR